MSKPRRTLPPGAKWITFDSGARRVELVLDVGIDPATGKRRQTRRRFKTADEAIDAYAKIHTSTRNGTYVGQSGITVAKACQDWIDGRRLRPSTIANYRQQLKPVIRTYGALPVRDLTKHHVDELVRDLQAGNVQRADKQRARKWGPRSVNLMLTVLVMVLDDAQRQGLVARNVVKLVDRVPQSKHEMQTYTPAEVRKVLARARDDRLEHVWHLALSGLRRGELCGLTWADVDLPASLTIRQTRVVVDGQVAAGVPKTEAGNRTLPLTPELAKVLRQAKRRQLAERLKAGAAYAEGDHLVSDELGRPLHPETVSAYWDQLVVAAGVRRIRLHDARHTCGTLMHLEGVATAVIAAWLGHSDGSFTMRTYIHSQDDALRAAAKSLGSVTGL